MPEAFQSHHIWLSLGIALIIFELFVPGTFLAFIGIAAIITGFLVYLFELSLNTQLFMFALFGFLFVIIGRLVLKKLKVKDKRLNVDVSNRLQYLLGEVIVLENKMEDGVAQARIADGIWTVYAQDNNLSLPVGSKVKIISLSNGKLIVEPFIEYR
ncbi:NfeD family protein [Desulfovibrio litoralis]|uniref:NfeD-like C-terminal domain-containing protein n=1 Tax=Desulfovibrio litoralis DSM 11393 TaxID=1121455 RepID=A0A1M7TIH2_9BACT|nr:NfeD family protein [Desulfovibrio litoralis]SHN70481.1 hypothetical protein SAMN02745728_02050 [Desulfovibrio litoralis DSM 11393]